MRDIKAILIIKFVDPKLYPTVFPMLLDPVCQNWFYFVDPKHVESWGNITRDLMKQYEQNNVIQTSLRESEVLKHENNEGFTTYLIRWRENSANMVSRPAEKGLISIFVDNLFPKYKIHLEYLGTERFTKLYNIGLQIEDDMLKTAQNENDRYQGNNTKKKKITDPLRSKDGEANLLEAPNKSFERIQGGHSLQ